jgi:hypothetical protein
LPKDGGNLDVLLVYAAIKKSSAKEKIFSSMNLHYGGIYPYSL